MHYLCVVQCKLYKTKILCRVFSFRYDSSNTGSSPRSLPVHPLTNKHGRFCWSRPKRLTLDAAYTHTLCLLNVQLRHNICKYSYAVRDIKLIQIALCPPAGGVKASLKHSHSHNSHAQTQMFVPVKNKKLPYRSQNFCSSHR
jgi:hypothetical protein